MLLSSLSIEAPPLLLHPPPTRLFSCQNPNPNPNPNPSPNALPTLLPPSLAIDPSSSSVAESFSHCCGSGSRLGNKGKEQEPEPAVRSCQRERETEQLIGLNFDSWSDGAGGLADEADSEGALTQLCEILSIGTEDSLGSFCHVPRNKDLQRTHVWCYIDAHVHLSKLHQQLDVDLRFSPLLTASLASLCKITISNDLAVFHTKKVNWQN